MTQETKLGLFVLVGIVCFVASIMLLGDFQFQRRYDLNVIFSDIAGLPAKAKVKIAGVEVGAVKKVTLEGNKAKLTVWIKNDIKIHSDSRASIVATGIIGSKFLELTMGSEDLPILKDGDSIRGIDPISLEKIVGTIMDKLDTVFGAFESDEGKNMGRNLSATIANLKDISGSLRKAIYEQEQKLTEMVDNMHAFSRDMADITADNRENIKVAIKDIKDSADKLNRLLEKLDKGEGTLGKLVSDKEMGEDLKVTFRELKETSTQAKSVLKRMNLIETYWDYNLRYDTEEKYAHSDLGLKIVPRAGKYYYVGVANVGDSNSGPTDIETKNTLNFLVGKTFDNVPVDLYAGAIRSKGGVGMRVKPLWKWEPWRRLEITGEAYDFSRSVPVSKAKVNVGGRIKINNWSFIGAQVEDLYDTANVNAFYNLQFRDDDIAYILGLVGLAQ